MIDSKGGDFGCVGFAKAELAGLRKEKQELGSRTQA